MLRMNCVDFFVVFATSCSCVLALASFIDFILENCAVDPVLEPET